MAFYFDSAPVAVMAAAAVSYFAPLYLLSQGILGPSVVQLAAVRNTSNMTCYLSLSRYVFRANILE